MRDLYAEYMSSSASPRDSRARATRRASALARALSAAIDADMPALVIGSEPTYLEFNVNNRLGPLQDGVEGAGAGRGHAEPDRFAAGNLEIEVVVDEQRLIRHSADVYEIVATLVGLRAVLRAGDRTDDDAHVLDRLARLIHD